MAVLSNIEGFLEKAKVTLNIVPTITKTIKELETIFPDSSSGPLKLEILKQSVLSVYSSGEQLYTSFEDLWKVIEPLVASIVSLFNKTGIFGGSA